MQVLLFVDFHFRGLFIFGQFNGSYFVDVIMYTYNSVGNNLWLGFYICSMIELLISVITSTMLNPKLHMQEIGK